MFQNIGKTTSYKFDQNYKVIDTIDYPSGKLFHTYHAFDPRLGIVYTVNDKSSVKASYSHTTQFMQLASNSNGGMPLDVWFPSSPNIKPQKADQYAIGYFRNFNDNNIETSVEVYYKNMNNVIDFKDHALLLMNPRMEGEIRTGKANAYGIEFSVKKNEGKLTGWVSYTLSKVKRKIPEINDGKAYPAPYDKPNNINIILNYEFTKRLSVSANWIYATGTPMTAPVGTFEYGNTVNKIYSSRNGYRMSDYHRLDLSVTLKGVERPNRFWHGEWVFSIYNAYGRHNDWIINFVQDKNNPQILNAQRMYLPFVFFPGITYNFNF
jgi:outer membrane receptor protein involved in Fe transport